MNNKELNELLDKHAQGNLSQEEETLLHEATHSHAVMHSSIAQANATRNKRRKVATLAVVVSVLAGVITLMASPTELNDEKTVVAQSTPSAPHHETITPLDEAKPTEETAILPTSHQVTIEAMPTEQRTAITETTYETLAQEIETSTIANAEESNADMTVLCNLECNADSVLVDVLRFLQA